MTYQESKNSITEKEFDNVCRQFYIMDQERSKQSVKQMSISPLDLTMFFTIVFGCALRPKELFYPTVEDFDLKNLIIKLPVTKTGFKQCKCSIWKKPKDGKKKVLVSAKKNCELCQGIGKIRKVQYTTIKSRTDAERIRKYFEDRDLAPTDRPFPYYQQILRKYFKQAGERAGLKIFTAKETRMIYNLYPYILRESRSKIMEDLGAKESMVKLKLRHSRAGNLLLRYQMPSLGELKAWEAEHYN